MNSRGVWDSLGTLVLEGGDIFMSELEQNLFSGCGRIIQKDNFKYWGQHKLWIKEGFGTSEHPSFDDSGKREVYLG